VNRPQATGTSSGSKRGVSSGRGRVVHRRPDRVVLLDRHGRRGGHGHGHEGGGGRRGASHAQL